MKKILFAGGLGLALAGCAYPQSSVEQGLAQAQFRIVEAPKGSLIVIDGRAVGERSARPVDMFLVEPGAHTVEERLDGRVLLHKAYSVDAGATVEVKG